jgi:uncharacterized protein (DUF342 family)
MQAHLSLEDESALPELSVDALKRCLAANGVTTGYDEAALARVCSLQRLKATELVARGTPARDAKDEEIRYLFHLGPNTAPAEGDDGAVDFRNVENFNNTQAGTVIAEKASILEGAAGVTVTGEAIPSKTGKAVQFKLGKGTELSADGNQVLASVDGHACLIADRLTVMETIEVPSHVDFSVGNIRFIGNVRIRGGVHPGFSVQAAGNVEINDNVEKASVVAGKNLVIRGIVFGQGDCLIKAGGDAHIGAIDQARLEVNGNLTIDSYLRHCTTLVGGLIELTGKKGNIVAGETHAFRGVVSPYIGNNMATLTKIVVGTNPFPSQEQIQIEAEIAELEAKIVQLNSGITMIQNKRTITHQIDAQSTEMLNKLSLGRGQIEQQIQALRGQLEALRHQNEFRDARIRVSEIFYPGVLVNFRGRLQYKSNDPAQHVSFYEEAAEVRSGPY